MTNEDRSMAPLVLISVLNWRDPAETVACAARLTTSDYPNKQIILSNNGDFAALMAMLAGSGLGVEVRDNGRNLGFSGGNNVVIDEALRREATYIWLFNGDAIPEEACLSRLVEVMENSPAAGLASPVIYHHGEPTVPWNAGGFLDLEKNDWGWFTDPSEANSFAQASPAHFVLPGTAMLIRVAMARKIGNLDEALFAYYEDIDYSVRAERAGFQRLLATNAAVFHKHGLGAAPAPHVCYYMSRNEILLWRKHARYWPALRRCYWGLSTAVTKFRQSTMNDTRKEATLLGWWDGQRGVTGEWDGNRRVPGLVRRLLVSRQAHDPRTVR